MIRKVVQCDRCRKQADMPMYMSVPGMLEALPKEWYRVSGGGEEKHFCTRTCIRRYYSSNDEEKQLCLDL